MLIHTLLIKREESERDKYIRIVLTKLTNQIVWGQLLDHNGISRFVAFKYLRPEKNMIKCKKSIAYTLYVVECVQVHLRTSLPSPVQHEPLPLSFLS